VTVINPGASPQEIETEVTDKVEGAVNTVSGIDELRSTSIEGVSQVFITSFWKRTPTVAAQEVRKQIDLVVNDLPETAEVRSSRSSTPTRRRFCVLRFPRPIAARSNRHRRQANQAADRIDSTVSATSRFVAAAARSGSLGRPDKMRAFNVSRSTWPRPCVCKTWKCRAVASRGQARADRAHDGAHPDPAQFNNLVVANRGPYAVKLSDIGYVEDGAEEQRTEARLNGQPAVTLVVPNIRTEHRSCR